MQYGGIRISNVLCDLQIIIKIAVHLNKIQMSMLKMSTLLPETFCQFSQLSEELQSFNCMQNCMIKAQLFYKKCLSIS
jgi:hypothetical protein